MTSPNTDEPLCNVARFHVEAEGWYRNKGMGMQSIMEPTSKTSGKGVDRGME